jgi:hypothetical protein
MAAGAHCDAQLLAILFFAGRQNQEMRNACSRVTLHAGNIVNGPGLQPKAKKK